MAVSGLSRGYARVGLRKEIDVHADDGSYEKSKYANLVFYESPSDRCYVESEQTPVCAADNSGKNSHTDDCSDEVPTLVCNMLLITGASWYQEQL